MTYRPDLLRDPLDMMIMLEAGPEPAFDPVTADFLEESYAELLGCQRPGSLLTVTSLGQRVPWLFRLSLTSRGLARVGPTGQVVPHERFSFALRFLPDFLHTADSKQMLRLVEPQHPLPFHPNIAPYGGFVCAEIYSGERLTQIALTLHSLCSWRLRNYRDPLNRDAAIYGRNHVARTLDDRPLFGRALQLEMTELKGDAS